MAGAILPWITLYAGLYGYRGTSGLYGWLVFGAGALAALAGLMAIRIGPPWLGRASAALGGGLFAFAVWLLAGLVTILRRPSAAMLVPRPGPGLFLVLAGAALILLAPVGERVLGHRGEFRAGFRSLR
jgi:hypothetical protein